MSREISFRSESWQEKDSRISGRASWLVGWLVKTEGVKYPGIGSCLVQSVGGKATYFLISSSALVENMMVVMLRLVWPGSRGGGCAGWIWLYLLPGFGNKIVFIGNGVRVI